MNEVYKNYLTNFFYNIHKNDYSLMAKYYAKNYLKFLGKKSNKILDLGCGMGHFLFFLKTYGFTNYSGVDISPECVAQSKKITKQKKIYKTEATEFLEKYINYFDAIVINDLIEHIKKEKTIRFLKIVKKSVTAKGILIIKTPNLANPITASSSRYNDFTHTVGYTEESLTQVLRVAGFRHIKIYPQNIFVFNPFVNFIGKFSQKTLNLAFRLLFLLYGRRTAKIFSKDIIAVAKNSGS